MASVNPYIYYFDNYIFLQPTRTFSLLPHSGQLYRYSQSQALLSGVEVSLQKTFFEQLNTQVVAEYLYNQQLTSDSSRNYPLPFTPANNLYAEVGYSFNNQNTIFQHTEVYANTRMTMEQDRIAQGDVIAELGKSGRATGPHLDWRMNLFTQRIDPQLLVGPMPAK